MVPWCRVATWHLGNPDSDGVARSFHWNRLQRPSDNHWHAVMDKKPSNYPMKGKVVEAPSSRGLICSIYIVTGSPRLKISDPESIAIPEISSGI